MELPEYPFKIVLRRKGETFAVLVSPEDYEWASGQRWNWSSDGYAATQINGRTTYMHRMILGLERGDRRVCDHINRDIHDNRRENLRAVQQWQNVQNQPGNRNTSSRHRGVSWDSERGRWVAQATIRGQHYALGRYDDEDEAGRTAAEFRLQHAPFATD